MRDVETIVGTIGELAKALAPRFEELARAIGPIVERTYWPDGAPETITWTLLWERKLERVREQTDELARGDIALAVQLGQPWAGGAYIRPETAERIAKSEALIREVEELSHRSFADTATFAGEPPPARLGVGDLVGATAEAMRAFSTLIEKEHEPSNVGIALCALMCDVAIRLGAMLRSIDKRDWAEQIESLVTEICSLRDELRAARLNEPSRDEPAQAALPTQPNGEATAALLERLSAQLARIAPTLADIVDREVFEGSPPSRVSFHAIQVALDTKFYGLPLPSDVVHMHELVADADRVLMPPDDAPVSALELFEGTADSIQTAAERLRELPEDERDQVAPAIELQSRLYLLGVVSLAHSTRRQLLVADIAAAVGLNPVPFPDDLPSGGSA